MADITFFYQLDENNQPVLDADNKPIIRQREQTATLDELKQMIADKRPQKAIDGYKQFVANGENWKHFDVWQDKKTKYEKALEKYQSDLEIYQALDSEQQAEATAPTQPEQPEPLSFEVTTVEQVEQRISGEVHKAKKLERDERFKGVTIEHNGYIYDADPEAMRALTTAILTLKELGLDQMAWKLADNTWKDTTITDLVQVLYKAGLKKVEIMEQYS